MASSISEWNKTDALRSENFGERRRDHSAGPRAPVQRNDSASGPPPRLALGQLIQRFVSRRVGRLTGSAKPTSGGRKEHDGFEGIIGRRAEQVLQAADFRFVHRIELFGCQV